MAKKFRDFKSAREFVKGLKFKDINDWKMYCKSKNKPNDIPDNPEKVYKNIGWKTKKNWLGIKIIKKDLPPFEQAVTEARKLARIHKISTITDWRLACEDAKITTLPSDPYNSYKKEWKGIGYWLGNNKQKINPPIRKHRSFKEAKEFVRSLGIKNPKEWREYCMSGKKPDDIPATPWSVYKKKKFRRNKNEV